MYVCLFNVCVCLMYVRCMCVFDVCLSVCLMIIVYLVRGNLHATNFDSTASSINIGIVFGHSLKYRIAPDVQGPKFYMRRPASSISLLYPRHVAIFL